MNNTQKETQIKEWFSINKSYLLTSRPNKLSLLNKLNKEGFDIDFDDLEYLVKEYKPFSKVDHTIETVISNDFTDQIDLSTFTPKKAWFNGTKWCYSLENQEKIQSISDVNFDELFKNIKPLTINKDLLKNTSSLFDRLVFTDVHIGMDPGDVNKTLYGLEWNADILSQRLQTMVNWTIQHRKSRHLIINDLGDFLDGFNSLTTRGGHSLPQNMSNIQMFEEGFKFKVKLIESLLPYFEKITFINICNDNHSGDFGLITNSAVKTYLSKYKEVEVINQQKFIDYYTISNRCFVLTHGKDDVNMKFGFKAKIDGNGIAKIHSYLNNQNINVNDYLEVEFGKGDSHLYMFDEASSDTFGYYNYPAFSPSSNWVQLNFNKGRSGFVHFNYYENSKSINTYLF